MHAVVVRVNIDTARGDEAVKMLNEMVVPMSRQAPGFKAGYWTRSADGSKGWSIEVFESEPDARAFSESVKTAPNAPASIESVEVMDVTASA